jgi:hypothetical protein
LIGVFSYYGLLRKVSFDWTAPISNRDDDIGNRL